MVDPDYNPLIGYTLLDRNYHVICPYGESFDPVFNSKERALEAAEEYGRKEDVYKIEEIHVEGTFNVVLYNEGDLKFDGQAATRFIQACKRRGIVPNKKAVRRIDPLVTETKYSCRDLFGDIEYNRKVALGQI